MTLTFFAAKNKLKRKRNVDEPPLNEMGEQTVSKHREIKMTERFFLLLEFGLSSSGVCSLVLSSLFLSSSCVSVLSSSRVCSFFFLCFCSFFSLSLFFLFLKIVQLILFYLNFKGWSELSLMSKNPRWISSSFVFA